MKRGRKPLTAASCQGVKPLGAAAPLRPRSEEASASHPLKRTGSGKRESGTHTYPVGGSTGVRRAADLLGGPMMRRQKVEIFKGKGKVQPWHIRLVGMNGETLALSEGYFSKWNAKRAAKQNFPGIPIEDKT